MLGFRLAPALRDDDGRMPPLAACRNDIEAHVADSGHGRDPTVLFRHADASCSTVKPAAALHRETVDAVRMVIARREERSAAKRRNPHRTTKASSGSRAPPALIAPPWLFAAEPAGSGPPRISWTFSHHTAPRPPRVRRFPLACSFSVRVIRCGGKRRASERLSVQGSLRLGHGKGLFKATVAKLVEPRHSPGSQQSLAGNSNDRGLYEATWGRLLVQRSIP